MDGPGILASSLDSISFIVQTLLQKPIKPIDRIRVLVPAQAELSGLPETIRSTFAGVLEKVGRIFEVRAASADISFKELNLARRFVVAEAIQNKAQSLKLSPSLHPAALRAIMLLFQNTPNAELGLAKKRIGDMRQRIESALNDEWLILTPALGAMPPAWDDSSITAKVVAATWQFTTLANMCGLPAVVFAPFDNGGPESSMQLIGGTGADLQLMAAAKKLAGALQACDKTHDK
jgi:Asp-tRNA(Asn)/Glu-tRNA(Gln) amidotransferase A subunit family amidase